MKLEKLISHLLFQIEATSTTVTLRLALPPCHSHPGEARSLGAKTKLTKTNGFLITQMIKRGKKHFNVNLLQSPGN